MPRWSRITLWVIGICASLTALFFAALVWGLSRMELDFSDAVYKEWDARTEFMVALSDPQCLTREVVLAEAAARGWPTQDEPEFAQCHSPEGLSDWLRVTMPDGLMLPEHPENATFFGFDAEGCSQYWQPALCEAD